MNRRIAKKKIKQKYMIKSWPGNAIPKGVDKMIVKYGKQWSLFCLDALGVCKRAFKDLPVYINPHLESAPKAHITVEEIRK